jgi:anthranilate synthase component 1
VSTLSLPADQHLAIEEAIASWRGTAPDCRVALLSWERTLDTLSALSLYDRLRSLGSKHFFLESLQGGERWGRYSFLGSGSVVELTAWADGLYLARGEQAPQRQAGTEANPIEAAQDFLANVCLVRPEDGSLPGGAVGYVSYDAARLFEPVLQRDHDFDPNCPLLRLWVPEILVRVDALRQSISLLVCVDLSQTLEARVKGEPWRQHCRQLLESGREKAQKVLRHLEEGQGTSSRWS